MLPGPLWNPPRLCADCAEPFERCICRTPRWRDCPDCVAPDGRPLRRFDTDAGLAKHRQNEHGPLDGPAYASQECADRDERSAKG